jgi:protein SCO1/2
MNRLLTVILISVSLVSCHRNSVNNKLAIIGPIEISNQDTLYHKIPPFELVNQDSILISNTSLAGKIYVADFFFTTCPSICPVMTNNMVKIQRAFSDTENFALVSHTVNPLYDEPNVLKEYASKMHANTDNWHFLTGAKEDIYQTAFHGYFANAEEDKLAPGGFLHSEYFVLVDKEGRIRSSYDKTGNPKGVYDGTNNQDILQLIKDIKQLLKE